MDSKVSIKERPILFRAPLVRTILDGSKSETRRLLKVQPPQVEDGRWSFVASSTDRKQVNSFEYSWPDPDGRKFTSKGRMSYMSIKCPYGLSGDQLWVRETCCQVFDTPSVYMYRATDDEGIAKLNGGKWTPSILMPRKASRIQLEITSVGIERLNDISEESARNEGCDGNCPIGYIPAYQAGPHVYHYAQLWESINGPGSWDANPWVWVIKFKRIKP